MTEEHLTVDRKGRIHMPKKLRDRIGVEKMVKARVSGRKLVIEPIQDPLDELAEEIQFTFNSVLDELPKLRKKAEEQLLKETMS
ncbi:MAG: hypothetical protein HY619_04640 [Thaumarchaeota archaeon]|nr:hypothetical protein [Nitrososphaerota archaeon]